MQQCVALAESVYGPLGAPLTQPQVCRRTLTLLALILTTSCISLGVGPRWSSVDAADCGSVLDEAGSSSWVSAESAAPFDWSVSSCAVASADAGICKLPGQLAPTGPWMTPDLLSRVLAARAAQSDACAGADSARVPSAMLTEPSPAPRYPTCAVVGSSSRLLHVDLGSEIDRADAVFRSASDPVDAYQKHVGNHTTWRVMSADHFATRWRVDADPSRDANIAVWITELTPAAQLNEIANAWAWLRQSSRRSIHMLAPVATELPACLISAVTGARPLRASTDITTVALALTLCDDVAVYGVGFDRTQRDHAYAPGVLWRHPFDTNAETRFLNAYLEASCITLSASATLLSSPATSPVAMTTFVLVIGAAYMLQQRRSAASA